MSEWLNNLKVGDKVIVVVGGYGYDSVSTVTRLTRTQIIVGRGSKYRRSGGSAIAGDAMYRGSIKEPTPEKLATISQATLARTFRNYSWEKLPLETLVAIWKLLPKKE